MALLIVGGVLISLPSVQSSLAHRLASYLSQKLGTVVVLEKAHIHFFNQATFEGLYIEDLNKDTLLYTQKASIKTRDLLFDRKEKVIRQLSLANGVLYLNRPTNSDEWNYDFILKAFASSKQKSPKKREFNFNLKEIELSSLNFYMKDGWLGRDYEGRLKHLRLAAKQIDYSSRTISLNKAEVKGLLVGLKDYPAGRPDSLRPSGNHTMDTTPFNPDGWSLNLKELTIEESQFYLDYPHIRKSPPDFFDADHLAIRDINTQISKIIIVGDTIKGHIQQLSAKEQSGLDILAMRADVSVSPILSECRNLHLNTSNSQLNGYYAMHYNRFQDFEDYIEKVKMVTKLKNSKVAIKDIAYFTPALDRYKSEVIDFNGEGQGTVSHLEGKNLLLKNKNTTLSGDLVMIGLPDIDQTYIKFSSIVFNSSAEDALAYAPEIQQQKALEVRKLGHLYFNGNYEGNIHNFHAIGHLNSDLGELSIDAQLLFPIGQAMGYSGLIQSAGFDFGSLLNQKELGKATFALNLKGTGYRLNNLSAEVAGTIQALDLHQYTYHEVAVNGNWQQKIFTGTINSKDPNAHFNFDGHIDFSKDETEYQFASEMQHIDFRALNLSKDTLIFSGLINASLIGNSLNDLRGTALLHQGHYKNNGHDFQLDRILVSSNPDSKHQQQLNFDFGDMNISLSGDFHLSDILPSSQQYLSYYIPSYFNAPTTFGDSRQIHLEVQSNGPSQLLSLLNPNWRFNGPTRLIGDIDLNTQALTFSGNSRGLSYGSFRADSTAIEGQGDLSGLGMSLTAYNIHGVKDTLISQINILGRLFRDTTHFQIFTRSPGTLGLAALNGQAFPKNGNIHLQFNPSAFNFNKMAWEIPSGNEIIFGKNHFEIHHLVAQSGNQKIKINSINTDTDGTGGLLQTEFEQINIRPLNNFLAKNPYEIKGNLNGKLLAHNILRKSFFDYDLHVEALQINQDTLGDLMARGNYQPETKVLSIDPTSHLSHKIGKIDLRGKVDFTTPENIILNGRLDFEDLSVAVAKPFLEGLAHNLSGKAQGYINVKGSTLRPQTDGELRLKEVALTTDVTGVVYRIDNGLVTFKDRSIEFPQIEVKDPNDRMGYLRGSIRYPNLNQFNFNLTLNSPHFKILQLSKFSNSLFYGDVDAKVNMTLNGPFEELTMRVNATPLENSKFYLTIDDEGDLGDYNYISFKNPGKAKELRPENHNHFNFILDAIATPDLETTIYLDPVAGDQIWARGEGNINLNIPTEGAMRMTGNYVLQKGTYDFSFSRFQVLNYNRQFNINENSSIKWNGSPLNAELEVTAQTAVKARLYDLIAGEVERLNLIRDANGEEEIRDAQIKQNVNILLNMKGSLMQPEMSFKLSLPEGRSVGTYAAQKLDQINKDEKQTLIQASSLLVLGQFVPPEGLNSSAVSSGSINNMSELVSSALSSQISNFANKVLGMEDLAIGVKYKNYSLADADPLNNLNYFNRNEAEVNLRKNFLNNRLIVEVGGVYDWGQGDAANSNNYTSNIAGDFKLQYLLKRDGSVRFSVFRTSDYDPLYSLRTVGRQGLILSYQKSFTNLKDLFSSNKSYPKKPIQIPKTTDSGSSFNSPNSSDTLQSLNLNQLLFPEISLSHPKSAYEAYPSLLFFIKPL